MWEYRCLECRSWIVSGWWDPICPTCGAYAKLIAGTLPEVSAVDLDKMYEQLEHILEENQPDA